MQKYKVLAIIGKAGSGKDHLTRLFLEQLGLPCEKFHKKISCTTRPPRGGEKHGVDYFYLTDDEFHDTLMIEKANFNGWWYGTSFNGLDKDKINIGIFNPAGVCQMFDNPAIELRVIEITCSDKVRLIRQLEREENPHINEIFRRYYADEEDFANLEFPHIKVDNSNAAIYALQEMYNQVQDWAKLIN